MTYTREKLNQQNLLECKIRDLSTFFENNSDSE